MREAQVSISDTAFANLGIEELYTLCQAAGLRDFEELACHGNGAVVRIEVETRLDEAKLRELEYIDQWEHVVEVDDGHVYILAFSAPGLSESMAEQSADLVGTCDPDVSEEGATMSLVGPQDAIAGTLEEYEREGASPDLRKLGSYKGRERPMDDLTDRQQEVIQTAFEMGYYEVPREATTSEIAAEVGVDPSTVTEHLQRAERNLLSHHLAAGD